MSNDLPDYQTEVSTTLDLPYLPLSGGTMAGNIAMGGNKVTGLGAPSGDNDAARKTDVDTVNAKLDDVSQAQPTRVLGTVYQNTGGKIRSVTVNCVNEAGNACNFAVYTDASNPPTTQISWVNGPASTPQLGFSASFIVKPGNYYKVDGSGGTTLFRWTEWDLF